MKTFFVLFALVLFSFTTNVSAHKSQEPQKKENHQKMEKHSIGYYFFTGYHNSLIGNFPKNTTKSLYTWETIVFLIVYIVSLLSLMKFSNTIQPDKKNLPCIFIPVVLGLFISFVCGIFSISIITILLFPIPYLFAFVAKSYGKSKFILAFTFTGMATSIAWFVGVSFRTHFLSLGIGVLLIAILCGYLFYTKKLKIV